MQGGIALKKLIGGEEIIAALGLGRRVTRLAD
jgi:hypothetical protein